MKLLKKNPLLYSILVSIIAGFFIGFFTMTNLDKNQEPLMSYLICSLFLAVFYVFPVILTIMNIIFTLSNDTNRNWINMRWIFNCLTIFLGLVYTLLYISDFNIVLSADWMVTLKNEEVHTPIFTGSYPTIFSIAIIGFIGYLILSSININKLPPLLTVLCFASMYAVMIECILLIVQVIKFNRYLLLCILPLNFIILCINVIKYSILQWSNSQHEHKKQYKSNLLCKLNHFLVNAKNWPIAGLLLMIPFLIIMISILVLFGQQPDAAIKAWTETSQWNLSTHVSPPNIIPEYNGHYLCTVAARGHKKLVKPIRLGIRNNHLIIVNRQLCIANAFEQILEEKTPFLHRHVRHFYDTYGLPLAKMINSSIASDIVYIIMKPLEWFFLIVLYLCDVNPENRIAIQYMKK